MDLEVEAAVEPKALAAADSVEIVAATAAVVDTVAVAVTRGRTATTCAKSSGTTTPW